MPINHENNRLIQLPERYLQLVFDLVQHYLPETEVWAYGSRVLGDYHAASDLDLVARFPEDELQPALKLDALREALSESRLPIFVQIVDWNRVPESFRDEIKAAHALLYTPALSK